jgi:hypothetical protein
VRKGLGCGIIVGLLLLGVAAGGAIWLLDSVDKVTSDGQTDGVIVDLIESRDTDGDLVYAPVIEYAVNGVVYRIESSVRYGGLAVPDIGDVRTVYYDLDNPSQAVSRGFWTLWFIPGLLTAIPLLVLVAMVGFAAYNRRKNAEGATGIGFTPTMVPTALDASSVRSANLVADFMGVEVGPMDDAGRMSYRVKAQTEVDGEMYRFEGPWLDEDPTLDYMRAGNKVALQINPTDPRSYRLIGPAEQ